MGTEWALAACSVAGSSHEAAGRPCQDAYALACPASRRPGWLILVCSDGAGSASRAEEGSREACTAFCRNVSDHLGRSETLTSKDLEDVFVATRAHLEALADDTGSPLEELACTLVAAIVGPNSALFVQVGDGAVVIESENGGHEAAIWPQIGQYANVTNFVTSENALEVVQYRSLEFAPTAVGLFTDGIQHLVLDLVGRSVPTQFFAPIWQAMRSGIEPRRFSSELRTFLSSDRFNERTDDDRTLVIAAQTGPDPGDL